MTKNEKEQTNESSNDGITTTLEKDLQKSLFLISNSSKSDSLDHSELEVSLDDQLAIDVALALHLHEAELRLECREFHLHDERVARDHGAAPLDVVHTGEEEITFAVRDRLLQRDHAADLRHGLDLQHTRHDRPVREVAVEELLVRRHLLHADGLLAWDELDDLVDEEKGIPVREDVLHLEHVEDRLRFGELLRPASSPRPVL